MQIILVHNRLAQARTINVTAKHVVLLTFAALVFMTACSALLYYLTFRHAADIKLPFIRELFLTATREEQSKKDRFLRENLNAMAVRIGELQAQVMRLEALGERVSGLAGIKTSDLNFKELPGRGGVASSLGRELSVEELASEIEKVGNQLDGRSDALNLIESELMNQRVRGKLLPTSQPVEGFNGSGFGWRIDPFTGRSAMHNGIDFNAPPGTPIYAAAGGVVVSSELHPGFGNMVDIDHGNDLVTRYAHASKVFVKAGEIVKRGQKIAEVGSTGRSTGPHLHFEVHVRGVAQDPMKFLSAGSNMVAALAAAERAKAQ
jgi:murein DD-endopeptidase MepM/ murein hydrolase activator NlpD